MSDDYNARLLDKMRAEQAEYRRHLLNQRPEEILNHTYEYTIREDILMALDMCELSPERAKALLKSPCPLDDVFAEFNGRETDHMETVRDSIESRADIVIKREKQRESR